MPFKRTDVEVTEVSFVDKPAVQKAKIFMTKRLDKGKVSFLKMQGGMNVENKKGLEKFRKGLTGLKAKFQKAVGSIKETLAGEMAENDFWDKYYDIMWAFGDLVYDLIMEDDSTTDKAAALGTLIDELASELKTATGVLTTDTQKGVGMDEKKILDAISGIGERVEGLGKRLDAFEAKGGKQPEGTEKAAGAEAGTQAGTETAEGKILTAVEGLGKKVENMGKRLDDIERQPMPSGLATGQEVETTKAVKWPSFAGGR